MKKNRTKKRGYPNGKDARQGNHCSGFTFIETLAVLAIGALLSAGAGISAARIMELARETSARQTLEHYKAAMQSYYLDCGSFPTTEQGLAALWTKPTLVPVPQNWSGPYLDKEVKPDPWGNDYVYIKNGSATFPSDCPQNLPYAVICYGADGVAGGEGENADIVSYK
ncbi:MAG: type II secretion system major pseudopilin GspG [Treponema sp.]|nr:type II secretion system major pseudopilin GspG [Treponema sp.]